MTLLKVNGVEIKGITSYDLKYADIDSANSGRSESGVMTREVVRRKVISLSVGCDNISTKEHQAILAAVNKDFVNVEVYAGIDEMQSAIMYTSEIDLSLVSMQEDLWNVKFQLAEQ